MNNEITIVTAFYNIGRENWNLDGSEYFDNRTVDTYFEYFGLLSNIDNDMIIYTSAEYVERVKAYRGSKPTVVIEFDFLREFADVLETVKKVHSSIEYQKKIAPELLGHPEYWSDEYTTVTCFKPLFLNKAVQDNLVNTDLVAWVDFGMCRTFDVLQGVTKWKHNFDPNKINIFGFKEVKEDTDIENIISNNLIYVVGTYLVCGKHMCKTYWELTKKHFDMLIAKNMIDDDQSLLAYVCSNNLNLFNQHKLPEDVWFEIFHYYNEFGLNDSYEKVWFEQGLFGQTN